MLSVALISKKKNKTKNCILHVYVFACIWSEALAIFKDFKILEQ